MDREAEGPVHARANLVAPSPSSPRPVDSKANRDVGGDVSRVATPAGGAVARLRGVAKPEVPRHLVVWDTGDVTVRAPGIVPPGWYPDPSGGRQWRAWNGAAWSGLTRPYATSSPTATPPSRSEARALDHLVRYGVGAFFAGLGLVVGVLAHWPHTARPVPLWFAVTFGNAGVAMLVAGTVFFALAARALDGHWSVGAVVPGLNVVIVAGLIHQQLTGRSSWRRVATETLLLGAFVTQSHLHPWLAIIPTVVALEHLVAIRSLVEHGASLSRSNSNPSP